METPFSKTRNRRLRAGASLTVIAAFTSFLFAQEEETEEDIHTLSPFTVDASNDTGYRAANTLAGSRLNTKLTDIASSVTVYTKEFLEDIGATSEDDLMLYASAATANLNETTGNNQGIGLVTDQFHFRLRGQPASRAHNYFTTFISSDTYNIDRFDESRGPNAVLFGLGGAGGILNTTTKRASTSKDFGSVEVRFRTPEIGSDEMFRASFDFNEAITENFAIRLNALYQNDNGWRASNRNDAERAHLAFIYKLHEKYTLRGEYEWGEFTTNLTRNFLPFDQISAWLDAGAPTDIAFTGPTVQANINQGIRRETGNARNTFIGNDGVFRDTSQVGPYHNKRASSVPGSEGWPNINPVPERLANVNTLVDPDLVPYDAMFGGPGSRREMDQSTYSLFLEGSPFENFNFEIAFRHDEKDTIVYDSTVDLFFVTADLNAETRDGQVNPYLGQMYIETDWHRRSVFDDADRIRATASYQFELGEKLGRHMIAASFNRDETLLVRPIHILGLGAAFNPDPERAPNRIRTRSYISDPSIAEQWQVASWEEVPASFTMVPTAGADPVAFESDWWTRFLGHNPLTEEGMMGILQSYWLNDKIVTTVGYRGTSVNGTVISQNNSVRDPDTNELVLPTVPTTIIEQSGDRVNYGIVGKPLPWLNVLYNYSQNYRLFTGRQLLIPDNGQVPVAQGQGEDVGIMLDLFDGNLYSRISYFSVSTGDSARPIGANTQVGSRNQRIVEAAFRTGQITEQQRNERIASVAGGGFDLFDLKTEGWEMELVASPTSNWNITFNASHSDVFESNLAKRTRQTMDWLRPQWDSYEQTTDIDGDDEGATIADEITDFDDWLHLQLQSEGAPTLGSREFQARLFARYNFREGPLKGAFVGGGYRYSDANLIGIDTATDTRFYGEDITEVDILIGYRTKVSLFGNEKRNLTLRLNANNLLQQDWYRSVGYNTIHDHLTRARVVAPATYTFSAKLDF